MLFSVESDAGAQIIGYVVSDSYAGSTEVVASSNGAELISVPARELREAVKLAGRHETGECGFRINETMLPGLSALTELEIRERETGVLIYRRCNPDSIIHERVLRLETQLLPLLNVDRALRPYFRLSFASIERFGLETNNQIFVMTGGSNYVSGRISYKNFEYYIDQGFRSIALLQDPYEELAERILVLRLIAAGSPSYLGTRDAVVFEAATAFAAVLPIESDRELRRAFRDIPESVELALGDPLVRQLTTKLPDEAVKPSSIGGALNTLSGFAVLGLRRRPDLFNKALAETFSLDPDRLPGLEGIAAVTELAARLRACPPVERLIENDLVLYGYVTDAFEKSGTAG